MVLTGACDAGNAVPPAAARGHGAGIGSFFTAKDSRGDVYRVTLVKVIDPAQGAGVLTTAPDAGYRFVAAVFTIRALTGTPHDEDANSDADIVGSDGLHYTGWIGTTAAGYTNFDHGVIHVAAGHVVTGAVMFEVTQSVGVARIEWTGTALQGTVQWRLASQ